MNSVTDFYTQISGFSNPELIAFESQIYKDLKEVTTKYVRFVKYNYNPSLDYLMRESQETMFIGLMTCWDFMRRNGLEVPDRFPQKFLLTVCLIKTKKGY